jgi:hypothetical protein
MTEERLPYWPAALNKKLAAAYCGLSSETFDKVCPVKPISFTSSSRGERYLRQRLDEWLLSIDSNSNEFAKPALVRRLGEAFEPTSRRSPQTEVPTERVTGPSGWPIAADKNDPLRKYYDKLGFDPHTMDDADMRRLHDEADAKWEAAVPGSPLQKREITTLLQLLPAGLSGKTDRNGLKSCRWDTEQRLLARGFIQTLPSEKYPQQVGYFVITQAGYEAARALEIDLKLQR